MTEYIDPYESLGEVSARVRVRTVSPVTLVNASLARIDALNTSLNAFITVAADQARIAAGIAESEINQGRWYGPLHGIPVAVKDFYDTAGIKTTAAFEGFANRVPAADADIVTRLKKSGAIVLGKTNMDALGMATTGLTGFYGPIANPWNADYIPGGSSSGSAAAVASGMCYATIDTDAVGSCRLPAACCGVVGFKGTFELLSMEGILAGEQPPDEMIRWFSHAGVTARRVVDVALVVDALQDPAVVGQPLESARELKSPKRLRVGVANNFKADAEVARVFANAVEVVAKLGHVLKQVVIPFAGPGTGLSNIDRDRKSVRRVLFDDIDVLLLPTTTTAVPRTASASHPQALSPENTVFANYYGIPAMSVPCGFDSHGLPLGLQIVGGPSADLDVLALGGQYEAAAGWRSNHPKI